MDIGKHAGSIRSFAQAYEAELRGTVHFYGDTLLDIAGEIAAKQNAAFPQPGSEELKQMRNVMLNTVFHSLQKDEVRKKLPSLHIAASLHAAFRWNKTRRFESNDLFDFFHAAAALGFCGAFFTERSLGAVITGNNIALDKLYNCHVVATVPEAIAFLETI